MMIQKINSSLKTLFAMTILLPAILIQSSALAASSMQAHATSHSAKRDANPAFAVRGLDIILPLPVLAGQTQEQAYRQLLKKMVANGFNTALLNLGNTVRCSMGLLKMGAGHPDPAQSISKKELSKLIAISYEYGIEPIIEFKILGKMYPTFSGENGKSRKTASRMIKTMPGLFRKLPNGRYSNTINLAYRTPDGKDVYDAVLFPLLDELLSLHGDKPARYFLLGIDEFEVDELAVSAKSLGTTAAELFADSLARMTEHLTQRGITPVIFGDMLLSTRLAKPGHGVKGFKADPRFATNNSYHSTYLSKNGVDNLTAMNHIPQTTRSKIIVADWHYDVVPGEYYPSVDYFQTMGFKDVWGAVWWQLDNIRTFSQYASSRRAGGMLLMTYGMLSDSSLSLLAKTRMRNAGTWFINPAYQPKVDSLEIVIRDAKGSDRSTSSQPLICLPPNTTRLHIKVPLPRDYVPAQASLQIAPNASELTGQIRYEKIARNAMTTTTLNYNASESALVGEVVVPKSENDATPTFYDLNLQVLSPDRRYMIQNMARQSILIGNPLPVACTNAADSDWLRLDMPASLKISSVWRTGGQTPGLLYHRPLNAPRVLTPVTYIKIPSTLWQKIQTQGMVWQVTFKSAQSDKSGYSDIVSLGNFKEGFRLFYQGKQKKVSIQFARGSNSDRLWLYTKKPVQPDQWTTATISLSAPKADGSRNVSLQINDRQPVTGILTYPLQPTQAPMVIGGEFKPSDLYRMLNHLAWNGQVRQIRISPIKE